MGDAERTDDFLQDQHPFKTNAFKIILTMVDWCNKTPGSKHFVDEILHSIFFLGKINEVPFSPQEIIGNEEIVEALKMKYPRPFLFYESQLPKRSPFSCVLDMIVLQQRPENEDQIKRSLKELIEPLNPRFLVSSTICVSHTNTQNSVRYYGVSMSTTGLRPGRIVIAASCCSAWDDYVAGAVMTYYPVKRKKEYFDGTFNLPTFVKCEAFNLRKGDPIHPCKSCANLFGLETQETQVWPYGNCAEPESLSNLLKNEVDVKSQSRPTSNTFTPENRENAQQSLHKALEIELNNNPIIDWNGEFYNALA
ncbi:uncharacterized protein [Embiotoca jacksoni]|uniref:uncharacterized protein n=1 Tax=Embiotoca jacksoni TaxID=100190 RepID=UPI003704500B